MEGSSNGAEKAYLAAPARPRILSKRTLCQLSVDKKERKRWKDFERRGSRRCQYASVIEKRFALIG
jgi:hypothetical protein